MNFFFTFSAEAKKNLQELKNDKGLRKRYKAVKKALYLLKENPKHPSLQTHPYYSLSQEMGKKTFEAYAE